MGNIAQTLPYLFGGTEPLNLIQSQDFYLYHSYNINPKYKVSAVIINITQQTSYDLMFTKYQQKSADQTCSLVYHATFANVQEILDCLKHQKTKKPILKKIVKQIKDIDPDCTIFNWQCCSADQHKMFPKDGTTIRQIKQIIDRGHMVMFSDWSLKGLINNWNQDVLGLNPFIRLQDYTGTVKLGFDKKKLLQCPSTQLKLLAQLSQEDFCQIKAPQKTILFTLNEQKVHTQSTYTFDLLTVALVQLGEQALRCGINKYEGAAGHVLLNYQKGCMLVSMGHWSELVRIQTKSQKLIEVAEKHFDLASFNNFKMRVESNKSNFGSLNLLGQQMIQSFTPGSHMVSKKKFL